MAARKKRGAKKRARKAAKKRRPAKRRSRSAISSLLSSSERELKKLGRTTKKLVNKGIAKIRSLSYV